MGGCLSYLKTTWRQLRHFVHPSRRVHEEFYEPLLQETEREAMMEVAGALDEKDYGVFFHGAGLRALATLSYSDSSDLQRSAAMAFAQVTDNNSVVLIVPEIDTDPTLNSTKNVEYLQCEVSRDFLMPLIYLLRSNDSSTLKSAAAALGNLATYDKNKLLIVQLGCLCTIHALLLSTPPGDVVSNLIGTLTNLTTLESTKPALTQSGLVPVLIKYCKYKDSKESKVQRNAVGAILNLTHSPSDRTFLVQNGVVGGLMALLVSGDEEVRYYCLIALSNIAVDASSRARLSTITNFIPTLLAILSSPHERTITQCLVCLRNLASESYYQKYLLQFHIFDILLSRLDREGAGRELVCCVMGLLRNMTILEEAEKAMLGNTRLCDVILGILGKGQGKAGEEMELVGHALSTVRNLIASDTSRRYFVGRGVIGLLFQRLEDGKEQDEYQVFRSDVSACLAVVGFTEDKDLKHILIRDQALLPRLIDFATSKSECLTVKGNCAAGVANLVYGFPEGTPYFLAEWPRIEGYLREFFELVVSGRSGEKRGRTMTPTVMTSFAKTHKGTMPMYVGGEEQVMLVHVALWTLLQLSEQEVFKGLVKSKFTGTLEILKSAYLSPTPPSSPHPNTHGTVSAASPVANAKSSRGRIRGPHHERDRSIGSNKSFGSAVTGATGATGFTGLSGMTGHGRAERSVYAEVRDVASRLSRLLLKD